MKKLFLSLSFLIFASLFVFSSAQTEKKIIIKKKVVDSNGTETVEEIILTGEDAENVDINDYINENANDAEIDIDVNIEKIIEEAEGSEGMRIFKFDGEDLDEIIQNSTDIPTDIKIKLKGINLEDLQDINISKDGERRIIILSDGENVLEEDMDEMLESFEWIGSQTFSSCDENKGSKTFLGVWPGESNDDKGVVLGGVVEESAAEKAGLAEGDIVTTIGGKAVKSFSELAATIKEHKPGEEVIIQYIRNGESRSANVTLGENKSQREVAYLYNNNDEKHNYLSKEDMFMMGKKPSCCNPAKEVEKAYIGIMIENSFDNKAVNIVSVNREDDVLMANDVITKFGKTEISDINQLIDAVTEYKPGDKVKVQYTRNGEDRKSKVTLLGRMVKESCTDSNCCSDKKQTTTTEIIIKQQEKEIKSDLGNSLLELQDVNLFPNPSEGAFQLKFTSKNLAPINITITDSNGREIIRDEITDFNGTYSGDFNLKGNTPGLYLVNITQEGKVLTEKVIIK